MSSACAYRDGNTDGPMYDSNGKKCDTMNHTTKMLLIAGCSAAGAALVALGIYYLIRRARISRRSSQSEDGNGVPARPLSAWAGQPGTMASGSNGYQYDTDGVDYQKYAARSRASSYMNTKAPDGSYSPVGFAEEQQGLGYVPGSPSGSSMQQQQQGNYYMQQQQQQQQVSYDPAATPTKETSAPLNNNNRRSYYDSNQQQPRGLPVPPQSAAMPPRRYSQTSQEQDINGDVYQYNYNYNNNQDGRVRSPSPSHSRQRAASPSAYYAHRQSREYDQGYAYDGQGQGQGQGMEEEGRERVEMLSPDLRYIQPGQ